MLGFTAVAEAPLSALAAAAAQPVFSATAASVLPGLVQQAQAAFTAQPVFNAAGVSVLPALGQVAQATFTPQVVFAAQGASVLPGLGQAAQGAFTPQVVFGAVAASVLPGLAQHADAVFLAGDAPAMVVRARVAVRLAMTARAGGVASPRAQFRPARSPAATLIFRGTNR